MRGNPVRKQVLVIAAVAIVIAAGAVAWYLLTQRHVGSILAQGERTNLLWVGHDGDGAVDAMTVVSLSGDDLVFLSVPPAVRVKGPDGTVVAMSDVYATSGGTGAARAVSDLLGIDVSLFAAVERTVWADWIDTIGGVTVALEDAAIYIDASVDPPMRVEIRSEERSMNGAEAVAFAVSESLPGDIGLASRCEALLRATLAQAVRGQSERILRGGIRERFASIETNCTLEDLFDVVGVLHDVPADAVRMVLLPTEIAVVDGESVVEPRIVEAERIVASSLKGLDLLTPDEVNIAVFNGNGIREMASRTAEYLRARGFSITRIGNADSFDYSPSYVVVLTDEAKAWVLQDALPPNEIRIVFPETFEESYAALRDYVPVGTDLLFIAGQGMELE
jgi:anionic cell wall polymer biosynthesis LytR-Cps2A-Psr (LCP) family protein